MKNHSSGKEVNPPEFSLSAPKSPLFGRLQGSRAGSLMCEEEWGRAEEAGKKGGKTFLTMSLNPLGFCTIHTCLK